MTIINQKNTSFGGRTTDISTQSFDCVVTTAKDGFFSGLSTCVWKPGIPIPYAKLTYKSSADKETRQHLHGEIVRIIHSAGEDGSSLSETADMLIAACTRAKDVFDEIIIENWRHKF